MLQTVLSKLHKYIAMPCELTTACMRSIRMKASEYLVFLPHLMTSSSIATMKAYYNFRWTWSPNDGSLPRIHS